MASPTEILIWIVCFILFAIVQSWMIVGVNYCCAGSCVQDLTKGKVCTGNIFYSISPSFFEKAKQKMWSKPLFSCVKCMSSLWSLITFWPVIIGLFGFEFWQIPLWMADAFVLIFLNSYFYKQI